jgi:hypothetical protein
MPESNRRFLDLTVKELIDKYIYRVDLDADYQREKVWSRADQEELLDSIIKNIDIPKLYLAEIKGNQQFKYECIDGKQRMLTLLDFFKPEKTESSPLSIKVLEKRYTYKQLKQNYPQLADKIENYKLNFVIYKQEDLDDSFIREIFRRLQLGIRLNSGEILNSAMGVIRDFIFKENGEEGPFFRNSGISAKRYSRQFTLAQICINSFGRQTAGTFVRARLEDILEFFEEERKIERENHNFTRINNMLKIMDKSFGKNAKIITSRAIAVSAYLFIEALSLEKKENLIPQFVKFYIRLLNEIKKNMSLQRKYEKPENAKILDEFQRHILQASVEAGSIKRRHEFLKAAFDYYLKNGKIIGDK